jgi:hypothetical protein
MSRPQKETVFTLTITGRSRQQVKEFLLNELSDPHQDLRHAFGGESGSSNNWSSKNDYNYAWYGKEYYDFDELSVHSKEAVLKSMSEDEARERQFDRFGNTV